MRSVWLNEVRARQIRSRRSMLWSEELAESVTNPGALNAEMYTLHRQIISAVETPPDAQRAVMLLVSVEGLSYREAATVLDVPIGTVMSRLARARLTVGQSLAPPASARRLRGPTRPGASCAAGWLPGATGNESFFTFEPKKPSQQPDAVPISTKVE